MKRCHIYHAVLACVTLLLRHPVRVGRDLSNAGVSSQLTITQTGSYRYNNTEYRESGGVWPIVLTIKPLSASGGSVGMVYSTFIDQRTQTVGTERVSVCTDKICDITRIYYKVCFKVFKICRSYYPPHSKTLPTHHY